MTAPASVVVDPKTHTATIQFVNAGTDVARLDVTLQYAAPKPARADSAAGTSNTAQKGDSVKADSGATRWSLASWVQDLPKRLTLAPHETRTVTLHLAIPAKLPAGDYSAYVVTTEDKLTFARLSKEQRQQVQQQIMGALRGGDSKLPFPKEAWEHFIHSSTKLGYHAL